MLDNNRRQLSISAIIWPLRYQGNKIIGVDIFCTGMHVWGFFVNDSWLHEYMVSIILLVSICIIWNNKWSDKYQNKIYFDTVCAYNQTRSVLDILSISPWCWYQLRLGLWPSYHGWDSSGYLQYYILMVLRWDVCPLSCSYTSWDGLGLF